MISQRDPARVEPLPQIIQGGMGIWVSNHSLARAVAREGGLGVVSGTGLDIVYPRLLQNGDRGALLAIKKFPDREISRRTVDKYFNPEGRNSDPFVPGHRWTIEPRTPRQQRDLRELQGLAVAAAFAEVSRAKLHHDGEVGINVLMKVALPIPATIYGAMLAGVDYVMAGAGSPAEMPRLLACLAAHEEGSLDVKVLRSQSRHETRFDPAIIEGVDTTNPLKQPTLLAIVSSVDLAEELARDPATCPDGFIIEGPSAGGHNAPPRGPWRPQTEPEYGLRDVVDLDAIRAIGLPFWLAGSYGSPDGLASALAQGAQGIQAGTIFALTNESGLEEALKRAVLGEIVGRTMDVRTDGSASPTGFPFKVQSVEGTLSDPQVLDARVRRCDLGLLQQPTIKNGHIAYLCPAEPVSSYTGKGGRVERTVGSVCLCNGLTGAIGLSQTRLGGYVEPPIFTGGADIDGVRILAPDGEPYSASEALRHIRGTAPKS